MFKKVISCNELEKWNKIISAFFPDAQPNIIYIKGGFVQKQIPTFTIDDKRYLIKKIKPTTKEDADFCMQYLDHLRKGSLPVTKYITNPKGMSLFEYKGHYYFIEEFQENLKNITLADSDVEVFYKIARLTALMHLQGSTFKSNHSMPVKNITQKPMVTGGINEFIKFKILSPKELHLLGIIINSLSVYSVAIEDNQMIKKMLIPTDRSLGNFLFNTSDDPVYIMDLDHTHINYRILDLVYTISYSGLAGEEFIHLDEDKTVKRIIKYIEGYNDEALTINLEKFNLEEVKAIEILFKLIFLQTLLLYTKRNDDYSEERCQRWIQYLTTLDNIFKSQEWINFTKQYA
jgi:Ser/Thr protein kinase RdoA (MazF antagonist)